MGMLYTNPSQTMQFRTLVLPAFDFWRTALLADERALELSRSSSFVDGRSPILKLLRSSSLVEGGLSGLFFSCISLLVD